MSRVQGLPSLQAARVTHLPGPAAMPGSHCSPASSRPLPQTILQSLSLIEDAPGGQQPSP